MLQLEIGKSTIDQEQLDDDYGTGIMILQKLLALWFHSDCLVCAVSFFSSVSAIVAVEQICFWYIEMVKAAIYKFPMNNLSNYIIQESEINIEFS